MTSIYEVDLVWFQFKRVISKLKLYSELELSVQEKTNITEPEEADDGEESGARMIFGCFNRGLFR